MAEGKVGPWARASGVALGLLVIVQVVVGFYLNARYSATPEGAPEAMRSVRDLAIPRFLQGVHCWASAWLILHGFLHLSFLILSGAYLKISKWAWLGSAALFGTAMAMQVTGNLLPFDRHDVQTAVSEGSIAAGMPVLGTFMSTLAMNGEKFGPKTLTAWHTIHLSLIAPLVVGGLLCLFSFTASREKTKGFVRFFWLVPLAGIAALALGLPSPYGMPATVVDYVLSDARPGWYVLPMHGALRAFESISPGLGWLGAALLPGVFALLIVFAPWLGVKRDGLVRLFFAAFGIAFVLLAALFAGPPAAIWGNQEVQDSVADRSQAAPIDERLAKYGFRMAVQNCAICHGKDLKGADGKPDLTVQFRRHADADFFIRFIKDPPGTKPGSRMPGQSHLPDDEIAAMAEWLRQPKP